MLVAPINPPGIGPDSERFLLLSFKNIVIDHMSENTICLLKLHEIPNYHFCHFSKPSHFSNIAYCVQTIFLFLQERTRNFKCTSYRTETHLSHIKLSRWKGSVTCGLGPTFLSLRAWRQVLLSWYFVCACVVSLELKFLPYLWLNIYMTRLINITCDFLQAVSEKCQQESIFLMSQTSVTSLIFGLLSKLLSQRNNL